MEIEESKMLERSWQGAEFCRLWITSACSSSGSYLEISGNLPTATNGAHKWQLGSPVKLTKNMDALLFLRSFPRRSGSSCKHECSKFLDACMKYVVSSQLVYNQKKQGTRIFKIKNSCLSWAAHASTNVCLWSFDNESWNFFLKVRCSLSSNQIWASLRFLRNCRAEQASCSAISSFALWHL